MGTRLGRGAGAALRRRGVLARSRARLVAARLERGASRGLPPVVPGNRVAVLAGGAAAYEAMLAAIDGATRSIGIEMYTWADDRIGRRFAERVAARARAGVSVLVLLDAFGSLGSGALATFLADAGARVLWYRPLVPFAPVNQRNHRKLVLVDGTLGFTGGTNIAEAYTTEFSGAEAWADLAIRVEGPAVREMARVFVRSWIGAGGRAVHSSVLVASPWSAGPAPMQVVAGRGLRGRRRLRALHLAQIASAQREIFIANAYFAPERVLVRALCAAARRGVRVELLLPERTDAWLVRWAGRASYERLLKSGVAIREVGHRILHAKVAVFDGEVLLTGSANLDYRSFRHNLEIAVTVFDGPTAGAARAALEPDRARAREVTRAGWQARPWTWRAAERVASAVRFML